jgi:hypothetical protein
MRQSSHNCGTTVDNVKGQSGTSHGAGDGHSRKAWAQVPNKGTEVPPPHTQLLWNLLDFHLGAVVGSSCFLLNYYTAVTRSSSHLLWQTGTTSGLCVIIDKNSCILVPLGSLGPRMAWNLWYWVPWLKEMLSWWCDDLSSVCHLANATLKVQEKSHVGQERG